jgi:hypothetical protein
METKETRVRMGAKQTSKGTIQIDLTAEAPTVGEAGQLLSDALADMTDRLKEAGLELVSGTA